MPVVVLYNWDLPLTLQVGPGGRRPAPRRSAPPGSCGRHSGAARHAAWPRRAPTAILALTAAQGLLREERGAPLVVGAASEARLAARLCCTRYFRRAAARLLPD
jgi:hypothetical protein